jgi:hypothetical protein
MIEDGLAAFASGFEYCELSRFGAITQPINVAGNLGFLILFFISWYKIGMHGLTMSALLIFIGSSLWHATLHPLGLVLDIVPILLWVIVYLWVISDKFIQKSWRILLIVIFLISALIITKVTPDIIPMRSGIFVGGSIALLTASFFAYRFNRHYAFLLIQSCFLLTLAIIARLADLSFCDIIPIGTHWLWHLLSAFALIPLVTLLKLVQTKNQKKIIAGI